MHTKLLQFSSVQFSHSVVSDSLRPHELQHARPPCPSPTPGVHSNSCPLSWWCHPAIWSSVVPFSSCPQLLQLYSTLYSPMDCSLPVPSVHGISQARIQEWVATSFSGGFSWPRDQTCISCRSLHYRQILCHWATGEPCCCKWHYFILFYGRVVFHCIYVHHLLYPFTSWWTFRLFSCLDYCE